MATRHREEVLNTVLATCIAARGVEADPETILRRGRARPDVIALFRGLRCGVEGKVADAANAKEIVAADARSRVEQGITHMAIAVVYPQALRSTKFSELPNEMSSAQFDFAVLTDSEKLEWHGGGINEILAELRRAHDTIVRDDVLQQAVDILNIGLGEVANALLGNRGTCERLIGLLGVGGKRNVDPAI